MFRNIDLIGILRDVLLVAMLAATFAFLYVIVKKTEDFLIKNARRFSKEDRLQSESSAESRITPKKL